MKGKKIAGSAARIVFLTVTVLFFIFPIYWVFTMSFKYKFDIMRTVPQFIPSRVTMENYQAVLRNDKFIKYMANSILVAVSTTALSCTIAAMAGFGITRYSFKGRSAISMGIFVIRMIPGLLYTIPIYMIYNNLKLLDTHIGLILAYCAFSLPLAIWLFIGFYTEISTSLYESAVIDGCSEYQLFLKIALPLVKPSIAVCAILSFIGAWNEFSLALVLTFSDTSKTLMVGISSLIQENLDTPFGQLAAIGMLAMLPGILVSLFAQKHMVSGFTAGAVKE